jgi:hypothetical protein
MSRAPSVTFVDEPFNLVYNPRRISSPMPHWFEYVCADNADVFSRPVDAVYALRYPLRQPEALRRSAERRRLVREAVGTARARLGNRRLIVKDPIAVFSVPWLADRYDALPVLCIRHPAGFVSSLLKLGWEFDFANWVDQPLFMRDCAGRFAADIERYARTRQPLLEQAILLWRVIYSRIHDYQRAHPEWAFVRHEDLAAAPLVGFEALFARCGLMLSATVSDYIIATSGAGNPADVSPEKFKTVHLDSTAAASSWRGRLYRDDVARIREATELESSWYYNAESWELRIATARK